MFYGKEEYRLEQSFFQLSANRQTFCRQLQEYKDLEHVLEATHKGKLGEKIKEGRESALMSKSLATIYTELPLDYDLKYLVYQGIHYDDLKNFYVRLELKSLLSKLSNIHNNDEHVQKMEVNYEVKEEFSLEDLNIDSINRYKQMLKVSRPTHILLTMSDLDFYTTLGIAKIGNDNKTHPTRAGLLMFGKEHLF